MAKTYPAATANMQQSSGIHQETSDAEFKVTVSWHYQPVTVVMQCTVAS